MKTSRYEFWIVCSKMNVLQMKRILKIIVGKLRLSKEQFLSQLQLLIKDVALQLLECVTDNDITKTLRDKNDYGYKQK